MAGFLEPPKGMPQEEKERLITPTAKDARGTVMDIHILVQRDVPEEQLASGSVDVVQGSKESHLSQSWRDLCIPEPSTGIQVLRLQV